MRYKKMERMNIEELKKLKEAILENTIRKNEVYALAKTVYFENYFVKRDALYNSALTKLENIDENVCRQAYMDAYEDILEYNKEQMKNENECEMEM